MPRVLPVALAAVLAAPAAPAEDLNEAYERAVKAAAAAAAPWVAKVETAGGREAVGGDLNPAPGRRRDPGVRKGVGPTTGVVVGADGYVVSSAFNFANNPTDVFVTVPGRPRAVAKVVATDTSRMLTLLKADLSGLAVPAAVPKADLRVGQTVLALGRALDPDVADVPSVSVGIVSATGRIWGKAVQTDAKVSPVNYGGPLVTLDGRCAGVLIPASPQADGDTAGVEWYDSGIGFAVPLDDVLAVLPRLKEGKDLRRGVLGVTARDPQDQYLSAFAVAAVAADGAAAKAGVRPGDVIVAVDGRPVAHATDLQYALGPKYAGDAVAVTVRRDGKEVPLPAVPLTAQVAASAAPFLGLLAMRDDPGPGVGVRYVYPGSPAAAADLRPGDRIIRAFPTPAAGGAPPAVPVPAADAPPAENPAVAELAARITPLAGRDALARVVARLAPGADLTLDVRRKDGKAETVQVKLGTPPADPPAQAPLPSSAKRALERPAATTRRTTTRRTSRPRPGCSSGPTR